MPSNLNLTRWDCQSCHLEDAKIAFGGKLPAMPNDSRKTPAARAEEGTAKPTDIPPEISQLIEGHSVRIDPDRYFSKRLRAALPLIQHRLKESVPNTFTLEPELFNELISDLRLALEKQKSDDTSFRPSDWISFVLGYIATGREVSQTQFYYNYMDTEGYWDHISLPSSLIDTPTSGSDQQDSNRVSLNVAYGSDSFPDEAYALEITIEGEPLRPLFDLAGLKMTPADRRTLQRQAKAIWSFLNDKISSRLGIRRVGAGRNVTNQGHLAAFAHDHIGDSWARVAQQLCKDEGCKNAKKHSASCRERYRKLAALYWKREAAKYAAMARERHNPQGPEERN